MRRWQRDLKRIPGVVSLELTGGTHIRLRLENGRFVICSSSPSDVYAIRNAALDLRRELLFVRNRT
jgi:hypothetical protein